MKIAQFMASKHYIGAERSFVELCNELSKSEDVVACVVKGCEFQERFSPNVEVVELCGSSRYNPFLYLDLLSLIKEKEVELIHTHSAKATEIVSRIKPFLTIPFVATKRNSESHSKKVRYFEKADFTVGVSEEVSATIKSQNKMTIYNGIEYKKIKEAKEPIFTMIAVGILQPRKGFVELIESVAQLPFDYRLWIVGEGEQRMQLEQKIAQLGLEQKIHLLGHREDVANLLAKAHLQIINSYREGLSRVLIEGLFYSDIVISTKVSGSVELLDEEFLFNRDFLSEKVIDIYKHYDRYKQRFLKIKERGKFFTLERVANEYKSLYKRLLGV